MACIHRSWRQRAIVAAMAMTTLSPAPAAGDDTCRDALFSCETDRAGKILQICATELEPGERWRDIQYRFGKEGSKPEFVFPLNPAEGAKSLFFSHVKRGSDYRVSVRFVNRGHTYRLFSTTGPDLAGVTVTDPNGKRSTVRCIERPHVFPSYLQRALACDLDNPHGRQACQDRPHVEPR